MIALISSWCVVAMMAGVVDAVPQPSTPEQRRLHLAAALAAFDRGGELGKSDPQAARAAYEDAVMLTEQLVGAGKVNGKLYYNLGNGYLQLGELGKAIVNYLRAEALIGRDPQLQANLRYARSLCRTQITPSGERQLYRTMFFWHFKTSPMARFWVALTAYALFWLLLAARSWIRALGLSLGAAAALLITLAAGFSLLVEQQQEAGRRVGVTVQNDIIVRKGNGEGFEPQFTQRLHEGVEFAVIEDRPGWWRVELPDSSTGWLRKSQAELVRPEGVST